MKLWVLDHNQVMEGIKQEFQIVENIEQADKVVLWNDVNSFERGIIKLAHNKPVIVMQHGRKGSSKYFPPFNEDIQADKLLVWGDFDKQSLIGAGKDPRKIEVVSTTVLQHLQGRQEHQGINIVFCPEHWDYDVEENTAVAEELKKLKGVNVITKIIESHDETKYTNVVKSNRRDRDHLDVCARVLATADLVVGISESTFELMAQVLDIPVVIVDTWKPKPFGGDMRYLTYRRVVSPGAKRTTVENLRKTIGEQLANPEELREERKQVAIDEGGVHLNAKDEIIKAINRA
jgi:hypothetical protein